MTREKADSIFLRPESDISEIDFNSAIKEKVIFHDNEVNIVRKKPPLFPYLRFTYSSNLDKISGTALDMDFRFEFDVYHKDWFYLNLGAKYNPHQSVETPDCYELAPEIFFHFAVPRYVLTPFIGLGVGYNIVDPFSKSNVFDLPTGFDTALSIGNDGFFNAADFYFSGQLGLLIMQFYELRYNFEMHNFLNENQNNKLVHMFSFGVRMPLRRDTFVREVLSQSASITKAGSVYAYDYDNLDKVTSISFEEGITEINGFANYNSLESVTLSDTVKTIGTQAFMNCSNLSKVDLKAASELTVISSQAFANDTNIKMISIPPTVTKIEPSAFEGWTPGQTVYLNWSRNSTIKRDLSGLEDTKALVLYQEHTPYKPVLEAYETVFNNPSNWKRAVESVQSRYAQIFVYSDNQYHAAINLKGTIIEDDEELIFNNSEKDLLNAVQFAKSVKFKVLGDGKKYMFYVVTRDGGCFAKEFKTKNGDITTVNVSLGSLSKRSNSKVRKLNMNNITFVQIVPVVKKWAECDAYFFDFEVEKK